MPSRFRPRLFRALGFLLVVVLLLGAAAIFLFPPFFKSKVIESARAYGITLVAERANVGWKSARLVNASATFVDVPGVTVAASEVGFELDGLDPVGMTIAAPIVSIEGAYADVSKAASLWAAQAATTGRVPTTLRAVAAEGGRATWKGAFGPKSEGSLDGLAARAGFANGRIDRADVSSPRAGALTEGGLLLGPFRASAKYEPGSRSELTITGQDAEKASLLVESSASGTVTTTANVLRSRAKDVGFPLGGIFATSEVELHGRSVALPGGQRSGDLHVVLFGARFSDKFPPVDAGADFAWEGTEGTPLPIKAGTFRIGPFQGPLSGTVSPRAAAPAVDLAYRSSVVACSRLVSIAAGASLGPMGDLLGAAASASGAVQGEVALSGVLALDLSRPNDVQFSVVPSADCGISLK